MEIGQVVDYVAEFNRMHNAGGAAGGNNTPTRRRATQADWDALMG